MLTIFTAVPLGVVSNESKYQPSRLCSSAMTNPDGQSRQDRALASFLRAAQSRAASPDANLFGLSLDMEARLVWKGVVIDHLAYPQGWLHILENEALRLAAACSYIERRGHTVTSAAVTRYFQSLAFAPGMSVPRYIAAWSMSNKAENCKLVVRQVFSDDEIEIEDCVEDLKQEIARELNLDRRFINGSQICSSLHYGEARVNILMDMEWAAKSLAMRDLAAEVGNRYLRDLDAFMADAPPVSYWEIERHHLHPLMADVAESYGVSLSNAE